MYGLFITVGLLLCLICTSLSFEQVAQSVASGTCRPSWVLRMSKSQLLNWERKLGSMAAPYSYVETQESGAEGPDADLSQIPLCQHRSSPPETPSMSAAARLSITSKNTYCVVASEDTNRLSNIYSQD